MFKNVFDSPKHWVNMKMLAHFKLYTNISSLAWLWVVLCQSYYIGSTSCKVITTEVGAPRFNHHLIKLTSTLDHELSLLTSTKFDQKPAVLHIFMILHTKKSVIFNIDKNKVTPSPWIPSWECCTKLTFIRCRSKAQWSYVIALYKYRGSSS